MPKITFGVTTITVEREAGDPKFYKGSGWTGARGEVTSDVAESRFLYWLKNILNEKYGFDLIKKRMWRDGHLVDDMQQYLRTRKPTSKGPKVMIWNSHWAITGLDQDFNQGKAVLSVDSMFEDENPSWIDSLMEDFRPKSE